MAQGVHDPRFKKKGGAEFRLASFEFENPTGFSPCGVVFGALRQCYSAPCKVFADDTGRTNRIKWFWAEPDAQIYEGKHCFSPRIDNLDDDPTHLYELTGKPCSARRYNNGHNEWDALGDHVDGDPEDFLGKAKRTKYYIGGFPPVHPCGLIQHVVNGIMLGTTVRDLSIIQENFYIEFGTPTQYVERNANAMELRARVTQGIPFGIELQTRIKTHMAAQIGIELYSRTRVVERVKNGFELAALFVVDLTPGIRENFGIELADGFRDGSGLFPPLREKFGIELADDFRLPGPLVAREKFGIELADNFRLPLPPVARDKFGIELGVSFRIGDPPPSLTRHANHIELGFCDYDFGGGENPRELAVDVDLDVPFQGVMGNSWGAIFRFTLLETGTFHFTQTVYQDRPMVCEISLPLGCGNFFHIGQTSDTEPCFTFELVKGDIVYFNFASFQGDDGPCEGIIREGPCEP